VTTNVQGNPVSIRIPEPLRTRLNEIAEANRRSFSQTVILLIEAGLDAPPESLTVPAAPAHPDVPPLPA
jgi:predicted DNA-binding protein